MKWARSAGPADFTEIDVLMNDEAVVFNSVDRDLYRSIVHESNQALLPARGAYITRFSAGRLHLYEIGELLPICNNKHIRSLQKDEKNAHLGTSTGHSHRNDSRK